jgi:hypothetical protein
MHENFYQPIVMVWIAFCIRLHTFIFHLGPMAPYDLVQMRAAGHAPIYEHPEHGHLRYKLSVGMETIDADRKLINSMNLCKKKIILLFFVALQRFAIMSCSDKILKWNVLGVQGALLSNLMEPIKLASITFCNNSFIYLKFVFYLFSFL